MLWLRCLVDHDICKSRQVVGRCLPPLPETSVPRGKSEACLVKLLNWLESCFHTLPAVRPWATYLTSLCLRFSCL